jgi:hypothetical protein
MIKLLKRTSKLVDASQASHWLTKCSFERQRPIRPLRASRIAHLMKEKLFRPDTAISFGRFNDQDYLVNGYHTLTALVDTKRKYQLTQEYYECSSMDEVEKLYASFDPQGSARSRNDINKALDLSRRLDITNATVANSASVAAGWISAGFKTDVGTRSKEEDADHAMEYKDEIQYMSAFQNLPKHVKRVLHSPAVMMVALTLLRKDQYNATAFFDEAAKNEGAIGYPPRFMCDFIDRMRVKYTGHAHADRTVRKARAEDYARVAIVCYIRWKRGEHVASYRPFDKTIPQLLNLAIRTPRREYRNTNRVTSVEGVLDLEQEVGATEMAAIEA